MTWLPLLVLLVRAEEISQAGSAGTVVLCQDDSATNTRYDQSLLM